MSIDGAWQDDNGNMITDKDEISVKVSKPLIFDLNLPKKDLVTLAKASIIGSFIVGAFFGVLGLSLILNS